MIHIYLFFILIGCSIFATENSNNSEQKNTQSPISIIDPFDDVPTLISESNSYMQKPMTRKVNGIEIRQYPVKNPALDAAYSGYHALQNAAFLLEKKIKDTTIFDNDISHFSNETSVWPQHILEFRPQAHLKDQLIFALDGGQRLTFDEIRTGQHKNIVPLYAETGILAFDKLTGAQWHEVFDITEIVIPAMAKVLLTEKKEFYSFDRETIKKVYIQEATALNKTSLVDKFDVLFPKLATISFAVKSSTEELKNIDNPVLTVEYLTPVELTELCRSIHNDKAHPLNKALTLTPVHYLEYPETEQNQLKDLNDATLFTIAEELKKSISPVKQLVLIAVNNEWMTCVLDKQYGKIQVFIIDAQNKDRRFDTPITNLIHYIETHTKPQSNMFQDDKKLKYDDDFLKTLLTPVGGPEEKTEINYDAPLAHVPLEDMPTIDQLLGKVPNHIRLVLEKLKCRDKQMKVVGTKGKNTLLFHGPPGTGKSTLCQVLARLADCVVLYAGGGDFRNAYQGSAKKLIDELFNKAREITKKTGKRVVILIDEVDGTTSKLQPNSSTQEDNRAVKVMLTRMDQERYNDDLFIMCTTNNLQNIDPAIRRRFICIQVPLPDYQTREAIIRYYLHKHNVQLDTKTPHSISSEFLKMLVTATDGFSGDSLSDLITSSVEQNMFGLPPEATASLLFRFNRIDIFNQSIGTNLAHAVEIPFMPVFHAFDVYDYTPLEQHMYGQLKMQYQLKEELEYQEWSNDPANKGSKDSPSMKRLKAIGAKIGDSLIHGACISFTGWVGAKIGLLIGAWWDARKARSA